MATVPSPISKRFFEDILKSNLQTQLKVTNIEVTNAVSVGENYHSSLLRILITFTTNDSKENELSVVAKCFPEDTHTIDIVSDMKCYENEVAIYGEVLPSFSTLCYQEKIAANVFHVTLDPKPILVLEDLKKLNFQMYKRELGLDLQHCLLVAEKLAYLHAASIAVYEQDPSKLTKFDMGLFGNNKHSKTMILMGIRSMIAVCQNYKDLNSYYTRIKSLEKDILEDVFKSIKPSEKFNVLNHGDCWVNNMLFSYDECGVVNDMTLVDFQLSVFSSPAYDLHLFWTTSPTLDTKKKHLETFLNHYYNALITKLKKLNVQVDAPNREDFYKDFRNRALCGFTTAIVLLPVITACKRSDAQITNYIGNEGIGSFRHHCFNNEQFHEHISYLLEHFDNLGMFDLYGK